MLGSCLCGQVRYETTGALRPIVACHCVQCRKTSGHFVAATSVAREHLHVRGDVSWYASSGEARRGFCGICGSSLFWERPGGARVSIHAGTLDEATGLAVKGHIFVDDKGDYYEIADGLPRAGRDDPDLTTAV